MRRYFFILFLLLSSLLSRVGSAQGPATQWMIVAETLQLLNSGPALGAFLQKSNQRAADPAFVYGVLHNARQLNDRGLPVAPYLLKANEGLAKGIPPVQIRPALEKTRQQTEEAELLVNESQARGLVFSNPQQRRMAIQEYQWALLNQTPSEVLRNFPQHRYQPGALPDYMRSWKVEHIPTPAWDGGWGKPPPGHGHGHGYGQNEDHDHGPGHVKKSNNFKGIDQNGRKGPHGGPDHGHGKNKQKF